MLLTKRLTPPLLSAILVASASTAAPPYADFLEPGFPFCEGTVDGRSLGDGFPEDNLSPRALILRLGDGRYAAFDTDLLRLAAVWEGGFLTPDSISLRSYQQPRNKMGSGQKELPKPAGKASFANGLYPGWSRGAADLKDPRDRGPDDRELGRGPLSEAAGRYLGTYVSGDRAVLSYEVDGCQIYEAMDLVGNESPSLVRHFSVGPHDSQLVLVVAANAPGAAVRSSGGGGVPSVSESGHGLVTFPPSQETTSTSVQIGDEVEWPTVPDFEALTGAGADGSDYWPESLPTMVERASEAALLRDEISLPEPNPWSRAVRPSDIAFFQDGIAAVVTFDGDVYLVSGLAEDRPVWKRIASGFHEPQGIAIRDGEVFVFSRGGLTRLRDFDGDGETDFYQLFANGFTQSAETRDFAHSLTNAEDGGFYLSKGGQQSDFKSLHSGRILKISADGADVSVFANGLRNGYVTFDPASGAVLASDQQGHWTPATPFRVIEKGSYLGFKPAAPAGVPEPSMAPPTTWIPHRVAQSAIDVIPLSDHRLGWLNGSMLVLDYYRPGLVQILPDFGRTPAEAAAIPLPTTFSGPLLKGAVNPVDGFVYLLGFQVWGTPAEDISGFYRLRPGDKPSVQPSGLQTYAEGIHLRFHEKLDAEAAIDAGRYQVSSWSYRRSEKYGSGQFKADGSDGTDPLFVHAVALSDDGHGVFLAIPTMVPVDQLEVSYDLSLKDGTRAGNSAYTTPRSLPDFSPDEHGFAALDLETIFAASPTPREVHESKVVASAARGKDLYATFGCIACHSIDGSTEGKAGPSWLNLAGAERILLDGSAATADTSYLRRAILDPADQIVAGFDPKDAGMPSYRGILNDADVESLVLYIESL